MSELLPVDVHPRAEGEDVVKLHHGDDDSLMMTIRADRETRRLVAEIAQNQKFVIMGMANQAAPVHDHTADLSALGISRNWKIEDGHFVVWRAENKSEIVLPVAKGGTLVPSGVPEIHGMPDMIFEVAMAIKERRHCLLVGPTGTGKSTFLRWLAQTIGYNFVLMPITPDTDAASMVGEYMPGDEMAHFPWIDGPVAEAARASRDHPTILCFDEANRISRVSHYARIYSLLDDQRTLVIPEKSNGNKTAERIEAGKLFVCATANPTDAEIGEPGAADYIGVQELDPAFARRFSFQPPVNYPPPKVEKMILAERVPGFDPVVAEMMVDAAVRVRQSGEVRFPMSFADLMDWAIAIPYLGYDRAAEVAVIRKAPALYRRDLRTLLKLQRNNPPKPKSNDDRPYK